MIYFPHKKEDTFRPFSFSLNYFGPLFHSIKQTPQLVPIWITSTLINFNITIMFLTNCYACMLFCLECKQPQKEFRPPMAEIVESLMCLLQEHRTVRGVPGDGTEVVDPFERSFRSSNSRFFGSPTVSFLSVWSRNRLALLAHSHFSYRSSHYNQLVSFFLSTYIVFP